MGTIVEIRCDCNFSNTLYMGTGMDGASNHNTATNYRLHVKQAKFSKTRSEPSPNTCRIISATQIEQALQNASPLPLICPYCQREAMRAYTLGLWD